MSDDVIPGTVSLAEAKRRRDAKAKRAKQKLNGGAPPLPAPAIISPADLAQLPVPERQSCVRGWIPIGACSVIFGNGGEGKTLLAQMLQSCTAIARPWLGLATTPLPSLGLRRGHARRSAHPADED